jgi:putative sugar O-methyltransferase
MKMAKGKKPRKFLYFIVSRFFAILPKRLLNTVMPVFRIGLACEDTTESVKSASQMDAIRFEGRWINSVETRPHNEMDLVRLVISAFRNAKEMQPNVPVTYQPSGSWSSFSYNYHKLDLEEMAAFLRNFFRNEGISGLWGEKNIFGRFCRLGKFDHLEKANTVMQHYVVWRESLPSVSLKELDAPRVGNPWGYRFNGMLLYEPVFEYNFHAHYFDKLLRDLRSPVVLEIGGGFGGLAHHLLRCRPDIKYIGLDLPENILIQTYYLSSIFPDAKILTDSPGSAPLNRLLLDRYDIVLLPNFNLPYIESGTVDLIINVRSLSEMSHDTIAEYLMQIDRVGSLYFFHENIYKDRRDGIWGVPSNEFPDLNNFVLVASNESRWPKYQRNSSYPCQENLYIHRNALHAMKNAS